MGTAEKYAIGLDFGSTAGRALLLNLQTGEEVATAEHLYAHGVLDTTLPGGQRLGQDWALHDPDDYLDSLERAITEILAVAPPHAAANVIGIGVAATCCSVLPTRADGVPLCRLQRWRSHPHAWMKLWKHHSAAPVARKLQEVAIERDEAFLQRCGRQISSEWYFPKLIEIWLEDPAVYAATEVFVEVADWVVWMLCGTLRRSASLASHKAHWSLVDGPPSAAFFDAAYPGIGDPTVHLGRQFFPLGTSAGKLTPELATKFGLDKDVEVAVGNIDAFAAMPGSGVGQPGVFFTILGTSACDLVIDENEVYVPGVVAVGYDSMVPGFYGYEAGEAAAGDMLGWLGNALAVSHVDAQPGSTGRLIALEQAAASVGPGQTGLVALDWWNGNRSILGDQDLTGAILGIGLHTTIGDIYRSLLEAVGYGNRTIFDSFTSVGFEFTEIVAAGGITDKSPLLMQIFADICGLTVSLPDSSEVTARGAALFAAVAAGEARGGFRSVPDAIESLRPSKSRSYTPDTKVVATYERCYGIFKALHDALGSEHPEWLHALKRLRAETLSG